MLKDDKEKLTVACLLNSNKKKILIINKKMIRDWFSEEKLIIVLNCIVSVKFF